MEEEIYLSGYCRVMDGSRMVEIVVEDGRITEIDCGYPKCGFSSQCTIGQAIDRRIQEKEKL